MRIRKGVGKLMNTIWKYELGITDVQEINLPSKHEILALQVQNNIPCLWVLVDTEAPRHNITIITKGTGNPITHDRSQLEYIGTCQYRYSLVFHVFKLVSE